MKWGMRMFCASAALMGGAGCSRPPTAQLCPELAEGDLVITEIRGPQTGADNRGQWFEVFNASDQTVDLRGLRIEFYDLQGELASPGRPILVRTEGAFVDPGQYVTFGHHEEERVPPFVDETIITDYFVVPNLPPEQVVTLLELGLEPEDFEDRQPKDLLSAGRIDLVACGVLLDRVEYYGLPQQGTWSLDGRLPPDAESNDDSTNFCVDDEPSIPGAPQNFFGLPGTPQEENMRCAP